MTAADDPRQELTELVRQARAWVEWIADSGVDELPTAGKQHAIEAIPAEAPVAAAQQRRQPQQQPQQQQPRQRQAVPDFTAPKPQTAAVAPTAPEFERPATAEERKRRLAVLAEEVASCTKCRLHEARTKTAFARGDAESELVFVGEGPGAEEDREGQPFVGKAGQLLDKMIGAMGYERDEVYICNIVKCRPPKNRKPEADEIAACTPYLREQLAIVNPKVVVALGATGVQGLLGTSMGITRMRGSWKQYQGRFPLMPTFHPAYLLRSPEKKREVWNDLQQVMKRLGKEPPPPRRQGERPKKPQER